jgi:hypothetical protein
MTTTTHLPATRNPLVMPAVGTLLVSFAAAAFGTYGDGTPGAEHDLWEVLVPCGIALVTTGVVFGLVLPRALQQPSAAGAALTMAVLGAVLVAPAFWSGLVLPLAVGGLIAGRHTRSTAGTIAVALSALTCVAFVAIYVLDWMSTNNIG